MNGLIPKPEVKRPKWEISLFYISFFLFILTLISYVGFAYYAKKTNDLIQSKNIEIDAVGTEEQNILAQDVLKYERKIRDFSNLINQRQYPANFLEFLGKSTLKGVIITNMSLDIVENQVTLSGIADNFQILGQQEDFFKNHEMLTKTDLASASMDKDGKVNFNFSLSINPIMFKKQN